MRTPSLALVIHWIASVAAAITIAAPAFAQQTGVFVEPPGSVAYAGDVVPVTVAVVGRRSVEPPDLAAWRDFSPQAGGVTRSQQSINGRSWVAVQQTVYISRSTPGVVTLPPIEAAVDGGVAQSAPVRIEFIPPRETPEFKMRVEVEDDTLYVGEPTRAKFTVYFARDLQSLRINGPESAGLEYLNPSDAEILSIAGNRNNVAEIRFLDKTAYGILGYAEIDGTRFKSITVEQILIPRREGSLGLGPFTAAGDAILPQRRSGRFGGPETDRFVVPAPEVSIDVAPLPMEGRPAGFLGLVGDYGVRTSVNATDVNVGDPIRLSVSITGPSPIEIVPDFDLTILPELSSSFRVTPVEEPAEIAPGRKTISAIIRAASAEVEAVPPITISYFDPERGEYAIASSDPIPLRVNATRQVTIEDAVGLAGSARRRELDSIDAGIRHNVESLSALRSDRFSLAAAATSPIGVTALAAPVGAYAVALGVVLARRRQGGDPLRSRGRKAGAAAREAIRAASSRAPQDAAAAVSRALRDYVADRSGRPRGSLTAAEAARIVAGVDVESSNALSALLRDCDAAQYAGAAVASPDRLRDEAIALVDLLEAAGRQWGRAAA
ncbi:MAG: BatD family protein [Planctomycetota bacterium]|nr:BatD family protein [Planctomycetota bacterium]